MALGKHVILECYECDSEALANQDLLEKILCESAEHAGATILHSYFHKFDGGAGITGVVALAESHISVHTWPEHCYMAIDVFMCGDCDPTVSTDYVVSNLSIGRFEIIDLERGQEYTSSYK